LEILHDIVWLPPQRSSLPQREAALQPPGGSAGTLGPSSESHLWKAVLRRVDCYFNRREFISGPSRFARSRGVLGPGPAGIIDGRVEVRRRCL